MTIISTYLHTFIPEKSMEKMEDGSIKWCFLDSILAAEDLTQLVVNHDLLYLQYQSLYEKLIDKKIQSPEEALTVHFEMMELSDFLIYTYSHEIRRDNRQKRLKKDQKVLKKNLEIFQINFPEIPFTKNIFSNATFFVKKNIPSLNWVRLLSIRTKRVLDAIVPLLKAGSQFSSFMLFLNYYVNPIILWIGWLFFIPRTASNLIDLLGGTIEFIISKYQGKKRHANYFIWLLLELIERAFELLNDTAWLIGGILLCFVLRGALLPIAIYVNAGLFAYDIGVALFVAAVETIKILKWTYDLHKHGLMNKENKQYRNELIKRVLYEEIRLLTSIAVTSFIFLGIFLCLPIVAVHPAAVFIGVSIILLATLFNFAMTKLIEHLKSQEKLRPYSFKDKDISLEVSHHSFFKPKNNGHQLQHKDEDDEFELENESLLIQ